jgi:two-component system chemotaxis response regulator CheY
MQIYLKDYGETDIAVNGREAIEAFSLALQNNEPYDLVCLDIMMPEMDGMEALEKIREIEEQNNIFGLSGVKVIMTTAKEQSKDIFGAFNAGCEAYIIKPVKKEALEKEMRKLDLIKETPAS